MSRPRAPHPARVLLVVRHAHRDKKRGKEVDNGLSPKGRDQRDRLTRFVLRAFGGVRPTVASSPKLRCLETVARIAQKAGVRLSVDPRLDEGTRLRARSAALHREWRRSRARLTVWCSHGDLIPALMEELVGAPIALDKGGLAWLETDEDTGRLELRWLLQDFRLRLRG